MADETSAKAAIAAALIQNGQFPSLQTAGGIGDPTFDWRDATTFVALRKLTDAVYAAVSEPMEKPTGPTFDIVR